MEPLLVRTAPPFICFIYRKKFTNRSTGRPTPYRDRRDRNAPRSSVCRRTPTPRRKPPPERAPAPGSPLHRNLQAKRDLTHHYLKRVPKLPLLLTVTQVLNRSPETSHPPLNQLIQTLPRPVPIQNPDGFPIFFQVIREKAVPEMRRILPTRRRTAMSTASTLPNVIRAPTRRFATTHLL